MTFYELDYIALTLRSLKPFKGSPSSHKQWVNTVLTFKHALSRLVPNFNDDLFLDICGLLKKAKSK